MHIRSTLSFLVLVFSSILAFQIGPSRSLHASRLLVAGTENDDIGSQLDVAFLLPSNPENALLQDSAGKVVSKLSCHASAVVCNKPDADTACQSAKLVIALGAESPLDVRFVATAFRLRRSSRIAGLSQFALGGKPFAPLLDQYDEANPSWQKDLPFSATARDRMLMIRMQELFERGEVEDYVEAIQLYLDAK